MVSFLNHRRNTVLEIEWGKMSGVREYLDTNEKHQVKIYTKVFLKMRIVQPFCHKRFSHSKDISVNAFLHNNIKRKIFSYIFLHGKIFSFFSVRFFLAEMYSEYY